MEQANIQYQSKNGSWTTVQVTFNVGQNITNAMKSIARLYPDSRVRAIAQNGRVLDIL